MKPIIYIISILLLSSCSNKKTGTEKEPVTADGNIITLTAAQVKNAGIVTGSLDQRPIAAVLKLNGKIDVPPQNMVSVSVPLGGYLKTTKLLPGMHVSKGEVIAVMEDQQYIQLQQDYLMTKSKLIYGQLEYDRQKELNQSKASSDKVYQQAAAELSGLQITQRALSEKLQLIGINPASVTQNNISRSINIYSPINGFVTKVNVNIGKYVSPTEVLFEMVNPEDIHLNLLVFEKDVDKLFIGQTVTAFTNNDPAKKYSCKILLIGKEIGAERNTEVHCHFEQYDKTLIPGTYMNAEIAVRSRNSFVLPEDAVVRFENKQYAFVKKTDTQFEMIQVETGNTESGFTEILLADQLAKESFVTKGAYSLLMGLKNKSED